MKQHVAWRVLRLGLTFTAALGLAGHTSARQATPPADGLARAPGRLLWPVPEEAAFRDSVSPDGQYLAYGNRDNGDIYLRDFRTGVSRRLTTRLADTPAGQETGFFSANSWAFSRDNRLLAYSWAVGDREELRVVAVSGPGKPRMLLRDPDIRRVTPFAWAPDGSWLVAGVWRHPVRSSQLVLVAVADGSVQVLAEVPDSQSDAMGRPVLSGDARWIAFSPRAAGRLDRDVVLIERASGQQRAVAPGDASDLAIGWIGASDLVFARTGSGGTSLWTCPMQGTVCGPLRDTGTRLDDEMRTLSLTPEGSLILAVPAAESWRTGVFTMDFSTGQLRSRPTAALPGYQRFHLFPDARSPDGTRMAFVSDAETAGDDHFVVIRDIASGRTDRTRPALTGFQSLVWAPDGRRLGVRGWPAGARCCGVYQFDSRSGATAVIAGDASLLRAWAAEGWILFDRVVVGSTVETQLIAHDVASGVERVIHRWAGGEAGRLAVAAAPDGRTVYYRSPASAEVGPHRVIARDVATGAERELLSGLSVRAIAATAGGRYLMLSTNGESLLLPTTGGPTRPIPRVRGVEPAVLAWADDATAFLGGTESARGAKTRFTYWWVPLDARVPREVNLGLAGDTGGFLVSGSHVAYAERVASAHPHGELRILERVVATPRRLP